MGRIAITCTTCGRVSITLGGKQIGTISLYSGKTHHRQVLMLGRDAGYAGVAWRRILVGEVRRPAATVDKGTFPFHYPCIAVLEEDKGDDDFG